MKTGAPGAASRRSPARRDPHAWPRLAPSPVNEFTPGRRKVKQLTGKYSVPVLALDDGTAIQGSDNIISWARANPAGSEVATAAAAAGE